MALPSKKRLSPQKKSTRRKLPEDMTRNLRKQELDKFRSSIDQVCTTSGLQLNSWARQKLEYSPNSRAKCRCCLEKIESGEARVGIATSSSTRANYKYYHARCYSSVLDTHSSSNIDTSDVAQDSSSLPSSSILQTQSEIRERTLVQRKELVDEFLENWMLFDIEKIKKMVVALPQTIGDLYKVLGMDTSSFPYRGQEGHILYILRRFRLEQTSNPSYPSNRKDSARPPCNSEPEIIVIDSSDDECDDHESVNCHQQDDSLFLPIYNFDVEDDIVAANEDDDDISVGETLTCDQILQRKFDNAAANGEVVTID